MKLIGFYCGSFFTRRSNGLTYELKSSGGVQRIGCDTEHTPSEGGGSVVFFHVPEEAPWADMATARPDATLNFDSEAMFW